MCLALSCCFKKKNTQVVEFLQNISISLRVEIVWPALYRKMLDFFSVVDLNIELVQPECLGAKVGWHAMFMSVALGIPAIIVLFGVVLAWFMSKTRKERRPAVVAPAEADHTLARAAARVRRKVERRLGKLGRLNVTVLCMAYQPVLRLCFEVRALLCIAVCRVALYRCA